MTNLKEIPEGYEIDREQSTFENIVFKKIDKVEPKLPKIWGELEIISGYWINQISNIVCCENTPTGISNTNIFKTREQANAALALAQLSQLKEVYNSGWEADYDSEDVKYCIHFHNGRIFHVNTKYDGYFLSFKDSQTRELFLENFRDLIEQAKPLMS